MDTIKEDLVSFPHQSEFEGLISLDNALRVAISVDEWFTMKKIWVGLEGYDEEAERLIWNDFNYLMFRAVEGELTLEDICLLQCYRRPVFATYVSGSIAEGMRFAMGIPHERGKHIATKALIQKIENNQDLFDSYIELELTATLFDFIFDIFMGWLTVRECAADDCSVLFEPHRTDHRFHSKNCQQRQFMRKKKHSD